MCAQPSCEINAIYLQNVPLKALNRRGKRRKEFRHRHKAIWACRTPRVCLDVLDVEVDVDVDVNVDVDVDVNVDVNVDGGSGCVCLHESVI